MTPELFLRMLREAAQDAGRDARLLEPLMQSHHPASLSLRAVSSSRAISCRSWTPTPRRAVPGGANFLQFAKINGQNQQNAEGEDWEAHTKKEKEERKIVGLKSQDIACEFTMKRYIVSEENRKNCEKTG
ncbi:MAG: hypothetical protein V8S99_01270 [Oscillospiraceae bacterium]